MPNTIPNKERMKMPRQHMPEAEPLHRCHNFQEVNLGFHPDLVREEALRCLACARPTCTTGSSLKATTSVPLRRFVKTTRCQPSPAASVLRRINARVVV